MCSNRQYRHAQSTVKRLNRYDSDRLCHIVFARQENLQSSCRVDSICRKTLRTTVRVWTGANVEQSPTTDRRFTLFVVLSFCAGRSHLPTSPHPRKTFVRAAVLADRSRPEAA